MVFALFAGCGGDATGPKAEELPPLEPPAVVDIDLLAEHVVSLSRGGSLRLEVEARDGQGRSVSLEADSFSWSVSVPEVARALPDGEILGGPGLGLTWVTVRGPNSTRDSVRVWVQTPASEPSGFRISLVYAEDVPDAWRAALQAAARRWEEVIRAELDPVELNTDGGDCPTPPGEPSSPPLSGTERGVRIYVGMSGSFPPGTYVEAVAGPCLQRPLPRPTTILGAISINRDKPVEEIPSPRLRYLAIHEMGHVLGLVAIVQPEFPKWFDPQTGVYRGELALEGFRREFGTELSSLAEAGGHWIDLPNGTGFHGPFGGDVMSANAPNAITFLSVGALMDLGYPAAWYGAGFY